ncbi:MAG: endonuclease/exonuclease/phosphatase family protein [Clostridium sp.]
MLKKILIGIGVIVGVIVAIILGYIIFLTIKDYRPEEVINLEVKDGSNDVVKIGENINVVTSNIGFGGMDKDVHFFMDGGSMSRAISEERVIYNTEKASEVLDNISPNIIMFQEVDINSTRSYKVDQSKILKEKYEGYSSSNAINYDVPWLALPLREPHGKVLASQMTLTNKAVISSERIALPIDETWPQRLAGLDRAMLVTRMKVENNKELVAINVHLSAYDKGGEIRRKQLTYLTGILEEEYEKGNYVIIGGDWNQAIPGSDASIFETEEEWPDWLVEMPEDFKPKGYSWNFDKTTPSCRNAGKEYIKGYNFLAVIDGFMVSDNIEVVNTKTIDTQFEYSDHNPVSTTIKLK